ncbi:MAG: hypothetical protein OHK0039_35110 [Bacteroidia bacterium]
MQRAVFKARGGPNAGKYYSDRDEHTFFDTEAEAKKYDRTFSDAEVEARKAAANAKKPARYEEKAKNLKRKYEDYKDPDSSTALLFKDKDKAHDDVPVTKLDAGNAKKFMEKKFDERRAGAFSKQVINLGRHHHVIEPGTDIGLTPALSRPDLQDRSEGMIPLSREGKAKTYNDLSQGLDAMAARYVKALGKDIAAIRRRMGRDLDRMTRGNPPQGDIPYTEAEQKVLNEVAAVLRLDKGRVPKATKYIRSTMTEGAHSFRQLLADKYYVGAGTGGVEALRKKAKEDPGSDSEGSDIEAEQKRKKPRVEPLPAALGTGTAPASEEKKDSTTPVPLDSLPEEDETETYSWDEDMSEKDSAAHGVIAFNTWQEAAYSQLYKGQRIRITGNNPDISDRVFLILQDYDPSDMEYPAIPKEALRWENK